MSRCAIWSPAYASLSAVERERSQQLINVFAQKFGWDMDLFPSADGATDPGCWLPVEDRRQEFQDAWNADIVWAMRGGYGCIHLVDECKNIANNKTDQKAPLLIGYSDITVLHGLWQRNQWGSRIAMERCQRYPPASVR